MLRYARNDGRDLNPEGSPTVAASLLTPTSVPQTVTVQVANTDLTVTVTVTRSTAAVSQTATMPANSMPSPSPSTFTQNAWQATDSLARGDKDAELEATLSVLGTKGPPKEHWRSVREALGSASLQADFGRNGLSVDPLDGPAFRQFVLAEYQTVSMLFSSLGLNVRAAKPM